MAHSPESVHIVNMCMVTDAQGNVLVIDRKNPDWQGIAFPGGHVELGEAFVTAVIREVYEETGYTIVRPILRGTKQFKAIDGARYVVLMYSATEFSGSSRASSEGEVYWLSRKELAASKTAPDLMELVRIFDGEYSEIIYENTDGTWKPRLL